MGPESEEECGTCFLMVLGHFCLLDVIGCHLVGVRAHKAKVAGIPTKIPNKRGGVENRVLVKVVAVEKLIGKIESLKEKDYCLKIATVVISNNGR